MILQKISHPCLNMGYLWRDEIRISSAIYESSCCLEIPSPRTGSLEIKRESCFCILWVRVRLSNSRIQRSNGYRRRGTLLWHDNDKKTRIYFRAFGPWREVPPKASVSDDGSWFFVDNGEFQLRKILLDGSIFLSSACGWYPLRRLCFKSSMDKNQKKQALLALNFPILAEAIPHQVRQQRENSSEIRQWVYPSRQDIWDYSRQHHKIERCEFS